MEALYFIIATLLMAVSVLASKTFEDCWVSPATIFIYAYYSQSFLGPLASLEIISTYNHETFDEATLLALVAMVFLVVGYSSVCVRIASIPTRATEDSVQMFSGHPFLPSLALIIFVAASVVEFFTVGGFEGVRGELSYSGSSLGGTLALMSPPVFVAMFIGTYSDGPAFRKVAWPVLGASFLLLLWITLVTFGRHKLLLILLAIVLYYHFRIKPLRGVHVTSALAIVLFVSMFAANRRFGGTFMELTFAEIIESFAMFGESPIDSFIYVAAPLAGFEVFTQVISFVPSTEDYMYGLTYISSAIGLMFPRFLFGEDFFRYVTPAYWFLSVYSPYTTGHGFDFSMLSELYLNFGIFGLVAMAGIGYLVGNLSWTIRRSMNSQHVFAALYTLTCLIVGLRSDSNTLFKSIVYSVGFVFVLSFFARLRTK